MLKAVEGACTKAGDATYHEAFSEEQGRESGRKCQSQVREAFCWGGQKLELYPQIVRMQNSVFGLSFTRILEEILLVVDEIRGRDT